MEFNDLLKGAGFDLQNVAVMLHQPPVSGQRGALLSLVRDHPELFELYQDNHPKGPEATLKARKFAASFIVNDHGESRFVGLYKILSWAFESYYVMFANVKRRELGELIHGEAAVDLHFKHDEGRAIFDLALLPDFAALKGRLVVPRPAGRAYVRLAENCHLPITRIEETARFIPAMPPWDAMVMSAIDLRTIPQVWADKLSQWRGVYHIIDTSDGARYVGSAYGAENILGRWRTHVHRDRGVTAELGKRDPMHFQFSILELLAQNATTEDVVSRENLWKERLGTRGIGGLNRN